MKNISSSHGGDAVYGLGLLGALFYYIPHAGSFQEGFIGLIKAFLWPAFVVYKAIQMLNV